MSYSTDGQLSFDKDDFLKRKESAKEVERIVNTMRECKRYPTSISIALDSRWGSGKTYFLSMWKNQVISNSDSDRVVYYNAWEYDDCDSTLLPLVASIINADNDDPAIISAQQNERDRDLIEHAKIVLKVIVSSGIKVASNKLLGENEKLVEIVNDSIDEIKDDTKDIEKLFDKFNKYFECRHSLNDVFQILIPKEGKLWVFIDDLDRCKPKFALETLEDIKHFFDLKNVIFVFSVDIQQLINSVNKTYGLTVNADLYIRKFFDYIYMLPSPNLRKYIQKTFSQDRKRRLPEYLLDLIIELYENFDYSLREINQNLSHIYVFMEKNRKWVRKVNEDNKPKPGSESGIINYSLNVYLYFLIIRDKYNRTYLNIIKGKFSFDKDDNNKYEVIEERFKYDKIINDVLRDISDGGATLEKNVKNVIEINRLFCDTVPESFEKHMESVLG